ncbi:MAG: hypothetical protein ACLSHO_12900 [Dysosmobacter sp.]
MPAGHDGHAAMQLAAAKLLAAERTFSPKGEVCGSRSSMRRELLSRRRGVEMLKAGVMKGVDELAWHAPESNFPYGHLRCPARRSPPAPPTALTSGSSAGGPPAFPETRVDPIVIAGEIVGALQTLVSRRIQAVEPAVAVRVA